MYASEWPRFQWGNLRSKLRLEKKICFYCAAASAKQVSVIPPPNLSRCISLGGGGGAIIICFKNTLLLQQPSLPFAEGATEHTKLGGRGQQNKT